MGTPTVYSLFGQPVSRLGHPAFAGRAVRQANSLNLRELAAVTDAYVSVAPNLAKKLMLLGRGYFAALEQGEGDHAQRLKREIKQLIQSTPPGIWGRIIRQTLRQLHPSISMFDDSGDFATRVESVLASPIKIPPGEGRTVVIVDGYSSGALLAPVLNERGYTVVHVLSTPEPLPDYPYFNPDDYSSRFTYGSDFQRLLRVLKEHNPLAVIAGSEPGVELADQISKALGTPGNGTVLSSARRNKHEMHEALRHAGLRAVEHTFSNRIENILNWVRGHGRWPVVIKPLSSVGTEDVYFCHTEAEVKTAFEKIIGKRNDTGQINQAVLVEEYLEGTEYAVNTVSSQGIHQVSDIWRYDRHVIAGAATVYDQDWLLPFDSDEAAPLIPYGLDVLDALGIEYGPAHMEIKLTPAGPCLVEVGARMCGAMLPSLAKEAIGYSQVELSLLAYLNTTGFTVFPPGYEVFQHAAVVFLQAKGNGIMSYRYLENLQRLLGVARVSLYFDEGSSLPKTVDSDTVIGKIELLHNNPQVLRQTVATIRQWETQGYFETTED